VDEPGEGESGTLGATPLLPPLKGRAEKQASDDTKTNGDYPGYEGHQCPGSDLSIKLFIAAINRDTLPARG